MVFKRRSASVRLGPESRTSRRTPKAGDDRIYELGGFPRTNPRACGGGRVVLCIFCGRRNKRAT